jgi:hypothetical protein
MGFIGERPSNAAVLASKGTIFRQTSNSCYARDSRMCYGWRQRNHRPFKNERRHQSPGQL